MRRRLWKFLPVVLIALAVQVLAPIGACWAASIAASDPLHGSPICSGGAAVGADQTGQTGQQNAHDGACSICCVAHASSSLDTPRAVLATLLRQPQRLVWLDAAPDGFGSRPGALPQARAPPSIS